MVDHKRFVKHAVKKYLFRNNYINLIYYTILFFNSSCYFMCANKFISVLKEDIIVFNNKNNFEYYLKI